MQLSEIATLCGATHRLNPAIAETVPTGFAIDSRAVKPGEVFVAIPGERVDGHQFVAEVLDQGALAALVVHHRLPFAKTLAPYTDRLLFVTDTACAFQQMAQKILTAWNKPIVAVTGSAGKTTMKDLTAHVLEGVTSKGFKSLGNLNTSYGLPLTVGRMISAGADPRDFDLAVLEFGMSSYGEIKRLTEIAPPTAAIVGNVGTAHIEFFGNSDGIAEAKAEIVDGLQPGGLAILNADDPRVSKMRERRSDISILTFGIDADADVRAVSINNDTLGATSFELRTPRGDVSVNLPLLGKHNVYNALAAAAAGHHFGMSARQIARQLKTAAPSKMRGELIKFANGVTVIDDSYNSNPPALIQAVQAMANAKGFVRRIVVAGEMLELGEQGASLHRSCGQQIADAGIQRVIGVRGLSRYLVAGAMDAGVRDSTFCETPEQAAEQLLGELQAGDLVLVKGSRGVRTERVVERLKAALGGNEQ
ncbi:MAG: UDP-N-acetylmuramoyl-tripeptide--D-alanyl-D-alanine ligase [Blastocatellia bacterium]|nr:UDP-N-acetylmuramoyl-tripeptide--D-alanyl-D-alanine ligase [Blastocatellia bacterium]